MLRRRNPKPVCFDKLGRKLQRKSSRMAGKRSAPHRDHAEFFAALGHRIKQLRKERGWSLHHMVVERGYYLSQWQKFEKGSSVTIDSLLKMSEMFGMSLGELINSLGRFPHQSIETVTEDPENEAPAKSVKKAVAKRAARKS